MRNSINELKRYIKDDECYRLWKQDKLKTISDFDRFCIDHCIDIETVIRELEENRRKLQKIEEYVVKRKFIKDEVLKGSHFSIREPIDENIILGIIQDDIDIDEDSYKCQK